MAFLGEMENRNLVRRYINKAVGGELTGVFTLDNESRGQAEKDHGNFDWIRKANNEPDRAARRHISHQTNEALSCHGYVLKDSHTVVLKHVSEAVDGTRLISPTVGDWPHALLSSASEQVLDPCPDWAKNEKTKLVVMKDNVINAALQKKREGFLPIAVNGAAAYHAGGGFSTGGRHALEESMCVRTSLFKALRRGEELAEAAGVKAEEWCHPKRKQNGQPWMMHIPDNGVFLSPSVEVFRQGTEKGYTFEEEAISLEGIISMAMPNCNRRVGDAPVDCHHDPIKYREQLKQKWRATFVAAAHYSKADCVVLPDAGCGVFRNPPNVVGECLSHVLCEEFGGRFKEVVIAFPGGDIGESFAKAARDTFDHDISESPKRESYVDVRPKVMWHFAVHDGWDAFDLICQGTIEEQYQTFKEHGEPVVGRIPSHGKVILVNFQDMTQHVEGSDRIRNVQRHDEQV